MGTVSAIPDQSEQSIADAMPIIVWIHDVAGTVTYFNRHWTTYTGLTLQETLAQGAAAQVHPDDRGAVLDLMARSRETGEPLETSYRLRRRDGSYRWHHARVVPFRRDGARVESWLGTAEDVHERYELEAQRQYLVEASRVLGTSLDLERTLADVAALLVPRVADWCAIDLLGDDGKIYRPAVAHVDPDKVQLAWQLWQRQPPRPEDATGAYHVIRTGQPELLREITDDMLVAALPDPELLALYRGLGLRSAMTVPLQARERVIGTLSLVSAEGQRLFEERDLAFATELAIRIGVAVDNARLFGEATRARAAAEAMAHEVLEQSRAAEAAVLEMRRQRDEAMARSRGG